MKQLNKKINALRNSYQRKILTEAELDNNPVNQFLTWFEAAMEAEVSEVNAMSLATVSTDLQPTVRTVLFKEIIDDGFVFYTNYESRKGREISCNNRVGLLFFWKELEQQVRIDGVAHKLDTDTSTRYYQSRPWGSQVGAWASPQSSVISTEELADRVSEQAQRFVQMKSLPKPEFWGGYVVKPTQFEFWQGRESRLHDRFRYTLQDDDTWTINRLAP